ncbi:HAD family phosphatase [Dysgonomonas sp. 521]|uniref:HAD family hydrolase n=1 Tax=Dysgonomonas sp. 521 TaxID=2302932 RepID=UPI0013D2E677|nr:HAD family phosphatase [Dysgonomonas sp. 521]NDV95071.1 HAD family phosphatase [Dysgonomonas sp. 521]
MKVNIPGIETEKIKCIIFDFGGVIMDVDADKTIAEFEKLGIKGVSEEDVIADNGSAFLDIELGLISPTQFIEKIRIRYPSSKDIPEEDIWRAWNALLQPYEEDRINILKRIRESFDIYLLSNTNLPHREKFRDMYSERFGGAIDDLFIRCFYSDEMHLRKPDADIYLEVARQIGVQPDEILFIDDKKVNIDAAMNCGWQAYRLTNGERITDIFIG